MNALIDLADRLSEHSYGLLERANALTAEAAKLERLASHLRAEGRNKWPIRP